MQLSYFNILISQLQYMYIFGHVVLIFLLIISRQTVKVYVHVHVHMYKITFPISRGYLVTRCIGLRRKEERGSPFVRGSLRQACSYSLKEGSRLLL